MSGEILPTLLKTPANPAKQKKQGFQIILVTPANRYRFLKRGIRPETFPPEKDLTKPGRREKSQEKKIAGRENFTSAE